MTAGGPTRDGQRNPDRCDPVWEVTPRQVRERLDRGDEFLLMDCRTQEEDQIARIEEGRLMPMRDLGLHLDELRGDEKTPIVVYCHTGRRSLMVAIVLRQHGFDDARSMAGGIQRWSEEVDPSIPQY
jgi:rhodanese-related sulfurtransferase